MKPSRHASPALAALLVSLAFTIGCGGGGSSGSDAATDTGHKDGTAKDAAGDARKDAKKDTSPKDSTTDAAKDAGRDVNLDASLDGGAPVLVELSVAGAKSELTPAFSSYVFDYYVRCASGTNALSVTMEASAGAQNQLTQPLTGSPSLSEQTVAASVNDGAAIVATASKGSAKTDYWVRCLPHDFPPFTWKTYPDAGTPTPGYYLLGTDEPFSTDGDYAMVLDSTGVPVWYQRTGYPVSDVDTVMSGTIRTRAARTASSIRGFSTSCSRGSRPPSRRYRTLATWTSTICACSRTATSSCSSGSSGPGSTSPA